MATFEKSKFQQSLVVIIDLDERGWFRGHVENQNGKSVFEFSNEDEDGWPSEDGFWLVQDGFMRHRRDLTGLHNYLLDMGIAKPGGLIRLQG